MDSSYVWVYSRLLESDYRWDGRVAGTREELPSSSKASRVAVALERRTAVSMRAAMRCVSYCCLSLE